MDSLFINDFFHAHLEGNTASDKYLSTYQVHGVKQLTTYLVNLLLISPFRDETKALVVQVLKMCEPDVEDTFSHI